MDKELREVTDLSSLAYEISRPFVQFLDKSFEFACRYEVDWPILIFYPSLGIGLNLILKLLKKAGNEFFGKIMVQGSGDFKQSAASNFSQRHHNAFAFFEELKMT